MKIMVRTLILLLVIGFLASSLSFSSFKINAAPAIGSTTVTLYPIADAYVNSSSPDTNYGNENSLYTSLNSELNYAYTMFNLSSIPSDANVISAEFKVYLSDIGGYTGSIGTHYCSDDSWTELGITWNDKPSFAETATDTVYYGMWVSYGYDSWNVTVDVRNALSKGELTEVLVDHRSSSYAHFDSRESSHSPKLEIEYATSPVFVVHLESSQDTGATNDLGLMTFTDYTFSLPTDIDVVAGSYQVSYGGGYMFMRWETSGSINVSDSEAATTTVMVSGGGTLRAVGNTKRLEYTYDHGQPKRESDMVGRIDAVRFTPLFSGQLLMARFHIYDLYSFGSNAFKVHVMGENRSDLITPFEQTPTSEGWFDVDLSSHGVGVNEGADFYIGMEWINDYNPDLGQDSTSPSDRSWYWNGTHWKAESYYDYMIRAVVGTLIDHVVLAEGSAFHVTAESNSTTLNFQFIKEAKKLLFNVTGSTGTHGFCNITIPNQLLGGPFNVAFDEQPLSEVFSLDNGTHTWLYFTYSQSGHIIEITGTTVIPELPPLLLSLLFMAMTLITSIVRKKLKMTKQ